MATKYLDSVGLAYFWTKIKAYFQPLLVSGTNIKTINNESVLGSGNISIQGGGGSVLDAYPVGSCYTTSTNTDPSAWLGGTWVLIDKRFASANGTNGITWNATNTQDSSATTLRTFDWVRSDHVVWLRLRWYNKTAYTDAEKVIATIDMAALGFGGAGYYQWGLASANGLNGTVLTNITWSGTTVTLSAWDVVTRATSIPSTTKTPAYVSFPIHCELDDMADSACDQFIWQRVASLLPNLMYQSTSKSVTIGQNRDYSTYQDISLRAGTYTISIESDKTEISLWRKSASTGVETRITLKQPTGTFTLEADDNCSFWAYESNGLTISDITSFSLTRS